jgi:uncharacterized protein with GYD domain
MAVYSGAVPAELVPFRQTAPDEGPVVQEEDRPVATYITLIKWTEQGIRNIKESPQRLDAARQAIRAVGGNLRELYMVMGEYDLVVISEAPDDESYTRAILTIASGGAVRTTTMKAYTEEEYRRIIASLP